MNEADARAALLRFATGERVEAAPDAETWDQWVWLARLESAVPLLYHLVDTVPTDLTDEQRQKIRQLQGSVLSRCVQLEHHLLSLSALFAEHGIRSVALKGGATAHLDHRNPSWREVNDIDLLIDPADRVLAIDLIRQAGWVQGYALPGGHDEFTHAVTFVRDRMELDLHQRIGHRALGLRIPTAELLDRARTFEIAGSELLALDDVDRLIHSAVHAMASRGPSRRLSSTADVLLAVHQRAHLAAEALDRADRWRVRRLVERGVRTAHETAQLEVPAAWIDAMRRPVRRRDRLVDRAYLSPARRPLVEELAYLRLLDGWRTRWRYVAGYFSVDPEYAAQHGRSSPLSQARYVVTKLRTRSGDGAAPPVRRPPG